MSRRVPIGSDQGVAPEQEPSLARGYGGFIARHAKAVTLTWLVAIFLAFAVNSGALGGGSLFGQLQQSEPFSCLVKRTRATRCY